MRPNAVLHKTAMPTNVIAQQRRRVQEAIRSEFITRIDLARASGLRKQVLTGVLDSDWNPTSDTLEKLVGALDELGFFCRSRRRKEAGADA